MTGLELLRKKMMELGATKAQTESHTVDFAIAVLAKEGGMFDATSLFMDMREEYLNAKREMERKIGDCSKMEVAYEKACSEVREAYEKSKSKLEELINEADNNNEELLKMETPEMRDRYRMAVRYKEMAYTDNAYARTEYTKGLALIMAGINTEKGEGNE